MTPNDGDLLAMADRVTRRIANGPYIGNTPDAQEESRVRRNLAEWLEQTEKLARQLCNVRSS